MAKGRPRKMGVKRTASGRATRSRAVNTSGVDDAPVPYVVYFIGSVDRVKVGYTGNLGARVAAIESNSGYPAQLLGVIHVPQQQAALDLEASIHRDLIKQGKHLHGEWFDLSRADVSRMLDAAREKGFRASGGDDATGDVPILSSLAYASENTLSIDSFQGK